MYPMVQEELMSKLNTKDLFDNLTPGTFSTLQIIHKCLFTLRINLEQLILPRAIFFLCPYII